LGVKNYYFNGHLMLFDAKMGTIKKMTPFGVK